MAGQYTEITRTAVQLNKIPVSAEEIGLAERLRSGKPEAIQEIFNLYFDRLYSFVYHEVGRDHSITQDIVQDTFLSAIKSARNFKGKSHIYTWLVSIAHHKIADHYRKLKREKNFQTQPSDEDDGEQNTVADKDVPADQSLESAEEKLAIEQALNRLPFDYRQVLLLKYVEDMPVSEICQITHRSPKSIEGLLSRARKALRDLLRDSREG